MKYVFLLLFINTNLLASEFFSNKESNETKIAVVDQPVSANKIDNTISCIATNSTDGKLVYQKGFFQNAVFQNGKKLNPYEIRQLMSANTAALESYNSGRNLYVASNVISIPCGFMLGWELGARAGGGKGNDAILGVGAAGSLVGIIMGFVSENKIRTSLKLYNSASSRSSSMLNKVSFGVMNSGVGFAIQF